MPELNRHDNNYKIKIKIHLIRRTREVHMLTFNKQEAIIKNLIFVYYVCPCKGIIL